MLTAKLPTLRIEPRWKDTKLSLKGLSFKAVRHTRFGYHLCRAFDEDGHYFIDSSSMIDSRTSYISKGKLISILKELHECIPFGKIKIIGHYELTGEQLMEEILKPNK